jgi:hypothetical protein
MNKVCFPAVVNNIDIGDENRYAQIFAFILFYFLGCEYEGFFLVMSGSFLSEEVYAEQVQENRAHCKISKSS